MLEVTIQTYSVKDMSLRVTYIGGCITYHYYSSAQPNFFAACTELFINDDRKWFFLAPAVVRGDSERSQFTMGI